MEEAVLERNIRRFVLTRTAEPVYLELREGLIILRHLSRHGSSLLATFWARLLQHPNNFPASRYPYRKLYDTKGLWKVVLQLEDVLFTVFTKTGTLTMKGPCVLEWFMDRFQGLMDAVDAPIERAQPIRSRKIAANPKQKVTEKKTGYRMDRLSAKLPRYNDASDPDPSVDGTREKQNEYFEDRMAVASSRRSETNQNTASQRVPVPRYVEHSKDHHSRHLNGSDVKNLCVESNNDPIPSTEYTGRICFGNNDDINGPAEATNHGIFTNLPEPGNNESGAVTKSNGTKRWFDNFDPFTSNMSSENQDEEQLIKKGSTDERSAQERYKIDVKCSEERDVISEICLPPMVGGMCNDPVANMPHNPDAVGPHILATDDLIDFRSEQPTSLIPLEAGIQHALTESSGVICDQSTDVPCHQLNDVTHDQTDLPSTEPLLDAQSESASVNELTDVENTGYAKGNERDIIGPFVDDITGSHQQFIKLNHQLKQHDLQVWDEDRLEAELPHLKFGSVREGSYVYMLWKSLLQQFLSTDSCQMFLASPYMDTPRLLDVCNAYLMNRITASVEAVLVKRNDVAQLISEVKRLAIRNFPTQDQVILEYKLYSSFVYPFQEFNYRFLAGTKDGIAEVFITTADFHAHHFENDALHFITYLKMPESEFRTRFLSPLLE